MNNVFWEEGLKMNAEIFNLNSQYRDILNIIRCKPGIEKTVLAKKLDLAYKTLVKQLEELEEAGFIYSEPQLKVNEKRFYMCGISIGGSHCKVVIVDSEYRILSKETFENIGKKYNVFQQDFFSKKTNKTEYGYKYFETPDNRTELQLYINYIVNDIIKLYDLSQRENEDIPSILSIGIALTGSIDTKKQIIVRSHNIDYMKNISRDMLLELDTLQNLKQRGIEFVIDHNAKAMAVCEKFSLYNEDNDNHEYRNKKNIACVYLGSGIGCGIILNNRLIRGCRNFSGELGHIQVPRYPGLEDDIEETCTCGGKNCLEHFIIHDVFEMNRNDFEKATSEQILQEIECIEKTDKVEYVKKMQILGYYVGWAIDAITKLLNVGLIIFSGKMTCFITKAWSYLEPTVGEMNYAFLDCQLILSKYAALAPSIGAAILSTYPADELIEWKI